MPGRVAFDRVWKQFARGERHDSLRDLLPAVCRTLLGRQPRTDHAAAAFWAVRDVSFEVRAGEALGIIGRNGAGKSTILKLLTRILKPTQGSCLVAGRTGALIEVAAGFHPDLTGRENVFLQGAIMGMKRHEIVSRFDAIVDFAGLEAFIDTPVKRYSSGMNARLGFSIAAHLNPDVLLIDEVLAVGDRAFQQKCYARMKEFKEQGVAIVFVSHHLPVVAQLCTRALLLDQGSALVYGTPRDAIAAYTSAPGASDNGDVALTAELRAPRASARSSRDGRTDDVFEVVPGDRLELDVELAFHVDVDQATVGIVVWDLTRELYVYGASSDVVGVPSLRARAGERRAITFTFDAHLTRGVYAIEINVVDAGRHRFLAVARGLRHFSVVEHVSYDGIANLYLAGRETPAMRLASDAEAAVR
ncbi:MAG: ABC transporter ATP-binding protein [Vicinamibacterales bacterium]